MRAGQPDDAGGAQTRGWMPNVRQARAEHVPAHRSAHAPTGIRIDYLT
jgi:hypothetical protein